MYWTAVCAKQLFQQIVGFFGSDFIWCFTIIFAYLSYAHVYFYREKVQKYGILAPIVIQTRQL